MVVFSAIKCLPPAVEITNSTEKGQFAMRKGCGGLIWYVGCDFFSSSVF